MIMLDLDGTVYKGDKLIDGVAEAIENMREQGVQVLFCTNNSSKLPKSIANKLNNLGIDCNEDEIISSGAMAIHYIWDHNLTNVFVSGTDELKKEFEKNNIRLCEPDKTETFLIAMDPDFNYSRLTEGLRAATIAKKIIVCNQDRFFEKEDGIYPGNGGMVSSILYCSNRKVDVVIGKPGTYMIEYAEKKYSLKKEEILVIGDSVESDIQMANNYGCKSLLISNCKDKKLRTIIDLHETVDWNWSNYT